MRRRTPLERMDRYHRYRRVVDRANDLALQVFMKAVILAVVALLIALLIGGLVKLTAAL